MKISASIVTYNTACVEVNTACYCLLDSNLIDRILIIDNSPTDVLKKGIIDISKIDYIFNNKNLGYGTAHNIALRKFTNKSRYHIVMNSDISFSINCIETLYNFMEHNPDIGLVVPKVVLPTGEVQYLCKQNPTAFHFFLRRFFPDTSFKYLKNIMSSFDNRNQNYDYPMYGLSNLSGCFMFLRNDTLKKVGLFDENIFMYNEDADLTRRIHAITKTAYLPSAEIVHDFKGGVHKSWKLTWYGFKSSIYYFNKWGWF